MSLPPLEALCETPSSIELNKCELLVEEETDEDYHDELMRKYKDLIDIDMMEEVMEYNLIELKDTINETLPSGHRVLTSSSSQILASNIFKKCLDTTTYEMKTEAELQVKDKTISELPDCLFKSEGNRVDVAVYKKISEANRKISTLLFVEVHSKYGRSSKSFVYTIKKDIRMLFAFLRLLKAFGVEEPAIRSFVFPCIDEKHCVVKVSMKYDPRYVAFIYSIKCLRMTEVCLELSNALTSNEQCCNLTLNDMLSSEHAVYLTTPEVNRILNGGHLHKAKFGVLLMNDNKCWKKPFCTHSTSTLRSCARSPVPHMVNYTIERYGFFSYDKVYYDPLLDGEAQQCSKQLVEKVHQVIVDVHRSGLTHGDLRIRNVCFDRDHQPILIDVDFGSAFSPLGKDDDMSKFGEDLMRLFDPAGYSDRFLIEFVMGRFDASLLETSVVTGGRHLISEVIERRNSRSDN